MPLLIRRTLTLLWPAFLLFGCDKPGSADTSGKQPSPHPQVARLRHALRQQTPDQPAELRALLESALQIESLAARQKALVDLAWSAIETDPELAHEAFHRLPADNPEKITLIQHYAMRLAEQDPEKALAWANTLQTEFEIAAAKSQIALTIAETDPLRAANLLSESGIAGRDFDVALVQVIQRWAAQSPPDAAAWVTGFPPGAAREAGIRVIAGRWMLDDPSAAFLWFDTLKDPGLRKETARAMEGVILQQPQQIRVQWLQHSDARILRELEQLRDQAIKDVGDDIPPPTK